MEETIDATAPEIIIDSVLFLESHNNKNEVSCIIFLRFFVNLTLINNSLQGLFKVRVLPLKVERLTSDNLVRCLF